MSFKTTLEHVNVLLVDDDPGDRKLTLEALKESKLRVAIDEVEDGAEAMDYLNRQGKYREAPRPDLILLDLNMPRKDGREALREIKLDPEFRRIPVVVLTTSKADTDISKIYELGANSFIAKPVTFDSLVNVMKALGKYWLEIVELPASK